MKAVLRSALNFARLTGAMIAACLPARYWSGLDPYIPVRSSALPSAIATFLAGTAIGIPGFLGHASAVASASNAAMLKAATGAGGEGVTTAMPVGMTSLSLFTFLLMTPAGWATMYLCGTGFTRALCSICGEPQGDPILSAIDSTSRTSWDEMKTRRARAEREALEGPEVPDRIVKGLQVGLPAAELVIVASRRKPDWDAGTVVLASDTAYRVGTILERTINGRLRTLYPLNEHRDLEVFRRTVRYDIPSEAISGARPRETPSAR